MCQKCVDAIKKFWPNVPEDKWADVLWGLTCFPAGCGDIVAKQLEEMAIRSGQDLNKAQGIVWDEMCELNRKAIEEREKNDIT